MNPTFTFDIRRSAFDEARMASRYFPFGGNGHCVSLITDILTKRVAGANLREFCHGEVGRSESQNLEKPLSRATYHVSEHFFQLSFLVETFDTAKLHFSR